MRTLTLLALMALPALADELILRNGAVFRGVITEKGDQVEVRMDVGTMSFKRIDVREIRWTRDPLKDFELKLAGAGTAEELWDVALWAKEKKLETRVTDVCQRVIERDPEHAGARKELGYEKVDGRWVKGDDILRARGLVRTEDGRWMEREAAELKARREHEERLLNRKLAAEKELAELQKRIESDRIALERERLEVEREKIYAWRNSGTTAWGVWPWAYSVPGVGVYSGFGVPPYGVTGAGPGASNGPSGQSRGATLVPPQGVQTPGFGPPAPPVR